MLNREQTEKSDVNEDENTFKSRIRTRIEDHTEQTSGIRVFEHCDETTLDDQEQAVLARLREAHENWQSKNGNIDATDHEDAYKSVKVKV